MKLLHSDPKTETGRDEDQNIYIEEPMKHFQGCHFFRINSASYSAATFTFMCETIFKCSQLLMVVLVSSQIKSVTRTL